MDVRKRGAGESYHPRIAMSSSHPGIRRKGVRSETIAKQPGLISNVRIDTDANQIDPQRIVELFLIFAADPRGTMENRGSRVATRSRKDHAALPDITRDPNFHERE